MSSRVLVWAATATIALAVAAATTGAAAAPSPNSRQGWRIVTTIGSASRGEFAGSPVVATGPTNAFTYWRCAECSVSHRNRDFITHWNGHRWQHIALPVPLNYPRFLISIDASSASNLWVLTSADWAAVWNGSKWSLRPIPKWALMRGSSGDLSGQLAVLGPRNVWIFSNPSVAAHYSHGTWHKVRLPAGVFNVTALGSNDIWGLAASVKKNTGKLVYTLAHWNGSAWHTLALPTVRLPARTFADYALSADGPSSVWVVRSIRGPKPPARVTLLHWTGTWRSIKVPAGTSILNTVASDGTGGVWAIGLRAHKPNPTVSLYHYGRDGWSRRSIPKKPGLKNFPESLTSIPGTRSLWATGVLGGHNIAFGDILKFGP